MLFDRSCVYESKTIVWQHMTSVSSKYLTFSEKVLFSLNYAEYDLSVSRRASITKWLALAKLYISLIVMLFDRSCLYESKTIVWLHMTSVFSK